MFTFSIKVSKSERLHFNSVTFLRVLSVCFLILGLVMTVCSHIISVSESVCVTRYLGMTL